jgi:hypothetical protein
VFEYAVLVTSLPDEVLTVAQLYRNRARPPPCPTPSVDGW